MTKLDACLATIAALALLAAGPAPALAAPPAAAPLLPHVSSGDPAPVPAVAGLLSALAPLGVAGMAGLVYGAGYHDEKPVMVLALAPLALGAGQAYAGEPLRGLAVGAGSYVAGTAGLAGGLALAARGGPMSMALDDAIDVALLGTGAVVVGYYAWSILDAAGTAARARQAHAERVGAPQAARIAE